MLSLHNYRSVGFVLALGVLVSVVAMVTRCQLVVCVQKTEFSEMLLRSSENRICNFSPRIEMRAFYIGAARKAIGLNGMRAINNLYLRRDSCADQTKATRMADTFGSRINVWLLVSDLATRLDVDIEGRRGAGIHKGYIGPCPWDSVFVICIQKMGSPYIQPSSFRYSKRVLLLGQLSLKYRKLFSSSDTRIPSLYSGLFSNSAGKISLRSHLLELLEYVKPSYGSRKQRQDSNSDAPPSKQDSFLLERTKVFIFDDANEQWFFGFFYIGLACVIGWIGEDILIGEGFWDDRLGWLYRKCSGHAFTDRERVLIGIGCTVVSVWLCVQVLINLAQPKNTNNFDCVALGLRPSGAWVNTKEDGHFCGMSSGGIQ
jgi:hypothetical protein